MKRLNELTIEDSLTGLKANKFTSRELTEACLNCIKQDDSKIHAFVTVCEAQALKSADWADSQISEHGLKAFETHPLLGIPYGLKDNFCTEDVLTTASSNVLKNFVPPYESTVSKKLKEAGAVLLGKTNLDAFAHGSSTESSDFFTTLNPVDNSRLPGGSSGGSAAAVAADMCIFAIGSETAGSIRLPASWCGVVGLKPTYGKVSRYGVISMASSLDSPGPLTKSVEDARLVLEVIAGMDEHDATSSSELPKKTSKKLKIGVAPSYFMPGMSDEVKAKTLEAVEVLKDAGYEFSDVELLDPKYSIAVYTILQRSEVSSNLARYDGIRFGNSRDEFGFEAKKRIMLGTYTLSAGYHDKYYLKAQKVRTLIVDSFKRAFDKVDVIVAPSTATTAPKVGASVDNAMFGELEDALQEPSSLAGISGISVPFGKDSQGLPIGVQVMANKFEEEKMLEIAKELERHVKNENN